MGTFEIGPKHYSVSFVVDAHGEHEYVLSECHCEFGANHYADPSDPRPADDIDIIDVSFRDLVAARSATSTDTDFTTTRSTAA